MHSTEIFTPEKENRKQTITTLEIAEIPMKSIYVIEREDGCVKIGVSSNVQSRANTLSLQGGFVVKNIFYTEVCSNAFEIERKVHEIFSARRANGEWFKINFDVASKAVEELFNEISCKKCKIKKVLTPEKIEKLFCTSKGNASCKEDILAQIIEEIQNLSNELSKEYFSEQELECESDFWKVGGDFYLYAKGMNNRILELSKVLMLTMAK